MLDLQLVSTYRYEWNVSRNLTDIGTRLLRFLLLIVSLVPVLGSLLP